ncbi:MAG TPA: metallophosphoesterase [Thermomicrobiales bacterium]|nr:metallophosphoesterase [Thermomicrobiales bacterium]
MPASTTFLHLSDLHLAPPGQLVGDIDSMRQMQDVVARIRQLDISPEFIILSGDLSDDGSAASYEVVKGVLAELGGTDTPVLVALGNHDDRAAFRRVILGEAKPDGQEQYCYSQLIDGLRVIVLDSLIPGQDSGALGAAQLGWLEDELQPAAPRGTLIVLHHCCRLASPAHHYPAFIPRDVAELEAIVARHRGEVLGVLAGHSHQANAAPFGGTLYATAPAVLCQLDFFNGEKYTPIPGAGFNLCRIDDDQLVVHPELL